MSSPDRPTFIRPFGPPLLRAELGPELVRMLNGHADRHSDSADLNMSAHLEGRQTAEVRVDSGFAAFGELESELLELACFYLTEVERSRVDALGRRLAPSDFCLDDVWVNTAFDGDHNPVHSHGGHLSGVFYLDLPLDPALSERERYPNKRSWYAGQTEWILSLDHLHRHPWAGSNFFAFGPVGAGYLFPAWLPHQAHAFRGEGRRRTMSFNISVIDDLARLGS